MKVEERVKKIYRFIASTELAIGLFIAISLVAIPGTFTKSRAIYSSPLFVSLLAALAINLLFCSIKRFKAISGPVLILHGGVVLTLAGSVVASFGFVATSFVYENRLAEQFYRWDVKQDSSLGFGLVVNKINRKFTPAPVKIGVLKNGQKDGLHEIKTGESFSLPPYRIVADELEMPAENLKLIIYERDRRIGSYTTSGPSDLPVDFPYQFKLVAFQTPLLLREWVDLILVRNNEIIAKGTSEVNKPFQWGGLYFYNTRNEYDEKGVPYAGIQIVRDPGRWYVFLGMTIVALGAVLTTFRRWYGSR
ncbi:MAG: hypothetical protein WCI45_02640 [Desulfuromonadales bacterium]